MSDLFTFILSGAMPMAMSFANLIQNVSMPENKLAVQTFTATDDLSGVVSYSISGGADAAKFSIDANTGAMSFVAPPDYDLPGDANTDNVYSVEVTATSTSASAPVSTTVTVTITSASDALEKSLDFAHEAGQKIAVETIRNDEQDARLDDAEAAIATKASQADLNTTNAAVATKASQASLDTTNTNLTNVSNRTGTLEGFFDGNNIIKLENLPEQLRTGMAPLGTFEVGVDTLPAATAANEWQYYITDDYGQVDLSAAQDGSQMVDVAPKGWIISTGDTGWRYLAGGDGLTTVNNKTAVNGAVTITATDTPYTPSEASGLTSTTAKAGLDEVGIKVKELSASVGDASTYDPKQVFLDSYTTRVAQG